ncbi:MAG TPA: nitrate reductase subunit alpha, partial [Bacilli bacterium]
KRQYQDPVEAWASIVENEANRKRYQQSRGKGGFRRSGWDEVLEVIAAANMYTLKKYGPDRVVGFSPIPAMSYLSYAAGSRFLQLFGGMNLSFYDWYCDLPNAFPEIWGEQTDVCESADWYNSRFIVSMGSNLNMTRTPDVHFISEARHKGAKFVVLAPDFSQVAKFSDQWLPIKAGQDTAFWMAVNHVILTEFHARRQVPYFTEYLQKYTDSPFLIELAAEKTWENGSVTYAPKQMIRAGDLGKYREVENSRWKFVVFDKHTKEPKMPKGTIGFRWGSEKGKWNLQMQDGLDDSAIAPELTLIEDADGVLPVRFDAFAEGRTLHRGVPVRYMERATGERVPVATVFDLLMAQFGVDRGLAGDYPADYDDPVPYTPAWQESFTGIGRDTLIRFAREFAHNAEVTKGKSMVIIGAGINHWYNNNLSYRAPATALILCGCCGVNGGGLNHYVGQEKLALVAPWSTLAMAADWVKPARLQQGPIWHYINSDQWRYDKEFSEYANVPDDAHYAKGHTADLIVKAVRMGWMPFYPQFNKNTLKLVQEAVAAGAQNDQEIVAYVTGRLKNKQLKFAVEDPDAPENWPRVWFIWRGNALMASAKGHEYFLKHYLGTHTNAIADEQVNGNVREIDWRKKAPEGKMDLIVDINFRMDTSALYSDIVLPTATWYEKNDLNTTDMHSYIHPLGEAVSPCWESKSDWEIFKLIARSVSELAQTHFPEPVKDIVAVPLQHDTPDELAQQDVKDWGLGECEPVPGKTMAKLVVVERDYVNLYNRFISFGPLARKNGVGAHGAHIEIADFYDELKEKAPVETWNGETYPSVSEALSAANLLLHLAPETNGELAYRGFQHDEEKVGLPLADLAAGMRDQRLTFQELQRQPRRLLNSPCWSGLMDGGRAYAAYTLNVEKLVPWRTLTGRQHFYMDHPWYIDFGEHLPTYKAKLHFRKTGELSKTGQDDKAMVLNYLTPHGKWHIHSTYYDNHRMLTLSRGIEPCWLNDKDAKELGIVDNDWVEVLNDNGVLVTRAVVSARIQRGTCIVYHSPERTISVPKSQERGKRRGGGHNSLTRVKLNPVFLAGGYGQFTFHFNYWGPVGPNRDTFVIVKKLKKLEW